MDTQQYQGDRKHTRLVKLLTLTLYMKTQTDLQNTVNLQSRIVNLYHWVIDLTTTVTGWIVRDEQFRTDGAIQYK